jgi:hypothetical protein
MTRIKAGKQFEYRLQRLFFYEGCFTRIGVDFYLEDSNHRVTDVDVLALSFGAALRPSLLIGECKTSASGSEEMDRLLWLKGMVQFLDASTGFLAKTTLLPHIKDFARRLDLLAFDDKRIAQREMDLGISNQWMGSHNISFMENLAGKVGALAKAHPEVRRLNWFLSANFWWQDNFERFKRTCTALQKIGELHRRAEKEEHQFVIKSLYLEAIILLTVSFLYLAHSAIELTSQELQSLIQTSLTSGIGTPQDFQKLSELVGKYVREMIRLETGHYPTKQLPVLRLETPEYARAAVGMVERFLHHSDAVREILRFQDVLFYEYLLPEETIDWHVLSRLFPSDRAMLVKYTQNVVHFAQRSLDAPSVFSEQIMALTWDLEVEVKNKTKDENATRQAESLFRQNENQQAAKDLEKPSEGDTT